MKYKKLISHRGNLSGVSPDSENTPLAIENAIINGYDCEVDLWLSNKKLHLGHDYPQTEISINFLEEAKKIYVIKKPSKMRAFLFIKKLYFLQIVT